MILTGAIAPFVVSSIIICDCLDPYVGVIVGEETQYDCCCLLNLKTRVMLAGDFVLEK